MVNTWNSTLGLLLHKTVAREVKLGGELRAARGLVSDWRDSWRRKVKVSKSVHRRGHVSYTGPRHCRRTKRLYKQNNTHLEVGRPPLPEGWCLWKFMLSSHSVILNSQRSYKYFLLCDHFQLMVFIVSNQIKVILLFYIFNAEMMRVCFVN